MARSIFTITAPSDTMRLDSKNHGEVVLTVTNTSGRALRGRAKAVPQDPKQANWIKIGGEAEREFAVSGTQQFTVSVDVPKDGKPGKYSFRFDAVSVELPDEEYTQGPNISFSPLAPVGPTPGPKIPIWLIILLIVVFLVIVGLGIWLIVRSSGGGGGPQPTATATEEKVTVPNVGGGTALDDAEKQIRDQGLTPSVQEQASKDFQKGQVIKTDPPAGAEVSAGSTVKLLVAGQTVLVPANLVGMACPNAANAVGQLGLIPDLVGDGKATKLDCSSNTLVSAASPSGGEPVLAGAHVSLTVPGPRLIRIPWDVIRRNPGVMHMNPGLLEKMHK